MTAQSVPSLGERASLRTAEVNAALTAIYNWSYEPEIDQLRTLYANALERQWIALRELDWEAGIDREALTRTFSMGGLPVAETKFWREPPSRPAGTSRARRRPSCSRTSCTASRER